MMSWLYSNPADDASKYLDQIPDTISPYYQPYIDAGSQSLGTAQSEYGKNLRLGPVAGKGYAASVMHPGQVVNAIGAGYQESPGYDWQLEQGEDAITNAADAGGYAGTPQQQQYAASLAENLANQDYYNYLDPALNQFNQGLHGAQSMYNTGLQGEQQIANMGLSAGNDLANNLMQALMTQAQLSYAGSANEDEHRGGIVGDTLGAVSSLF